jgi:hypothetical protein
MGLNGGSVATDSGELSQCAVIPQFEQIESVCRQLYCVGLPFVPLLLWTK